MVTGQDHAFIQHHRLTFASLFHFRVTRNTARSGSRLVNVGIHQTEFQRCGRTQNLFRTRGVLNTRQSNHDTVSTLTLYQRLSDAQLVAAAQRLRESGRTGLAQMPWGSTGPIALTALARRFGLEAAALAPEIFYPVPWREAGWILDPGRKLGDVVRPGTVAVHLWNELIRNFKDAPAPPGSFLARLHEEGR